MAQGALRRGLEKGNTFVFIFCIEFLIHLNLDEKELYKIETLLIKNCLNS